jgi:GT2 family glycosyltransferase
VPPLFVQPDPVSSPQRSSSVAVRTPWLSVIIVNYRQWNETESLANQILSSPNAKRGLVEVIVVDNDSPHDTHVARLRRREGVSLRMWRRNRGFARAVNEGCRLSRGHWFLVLNPDVSLSDRFVEHVLELTERVPALEPPVGIVGFRLLNYDGGWQRSTGNFPTLARTMLRLLLPRARRKYNSPPNDRASSVPWITGCCMLMRRECVEQLGGLDEDFFLYYEDVDLCRRAQHTGWAVRYEPSLSVVHYHPLHRRPVAVPMRILTRHAFLVYCSKHWPNLQLRLVAHLVCGEALVRQMWSAWRGRTTQAAHFRELRAIAKDIVNGATRRARRRLARIVQPTVG